MWVDVMEKSSAVLVEGREREFIDAVRRYVCIAQLLSFLGRKSKFTLSKCDSGGETEFGFADSYFLFGVGNLCSLFLNVI